MNDIEEQWNKKLVALTNSIYDNYQNIGKLLDEIRKSMLLRHVKLEDHIDNRSVWYNLGETFFR